MQPLATRMAGANTLLASYAVPNEGALGRTIPEPEDTTRFPFQRDRDRIIHTRAFRRLKGKTQVFVTGEGDHYRTRLTHTVEVVQISRDIARTLALNEDLAECIALAHDLGHPPFGHAGEEALDIFLRAHGSFFEHNLQSMRIVTLLEEHSNRYHGLNLHREILEGLQKHRTPHDHPPEGNAHSPSLEAHVVNLADEIAYTGHDVEDGIRAELFDGIAIAETRLGGRAAAQVLPRGTSLRGAIIDVLVTDLYTETDRSLTHIRTLDDVYRADSPLLRFSPDITIELQELRAFLWKRMYLHPTVQAANAEGKSIVQELCRTFLAHPTEKILSLQRQCGGTLPEAVKDYVAGMTDAYAAGLLSAL